VRQNADVRRAGFLDLGGTLVLPVKPERLDQLTLIPGVAGAIARGCADGFVCPVITVQSGIAKGRFTRQAFDAWFDRFGRDLGTLGASLVGPYVCPHRFAEPCPCKKPTGLLYRHAAGDHDIDLAQSFVVGDSADDMRGARAVGARGCLVRTGWGEDPAVADAAAGYADFIASSLGDAMEWIVSAPARARGRTHDAKHTALPSE